MVRATREDRKTQTRRVFSVRLLKLMQTAIAAGEVSDFLSEGKLDSGDLEYIRQFCPYGQRGDRLWVKETCFPVHKWKHAPLFAAVKAEWLYRADYEWREGKVIGCHKWTPSILMPRRASRITLEIVNVRVERLQDISEADAIAEGVVNHGNHWHAAENTDLQFSTARAAYCGLWESINGPGSWAANPWVWVIEFRRVAS